MNQENRKYLDTITEVMKENENFLKENAKEVLHELIFFLSNDVIESVRFAAEVKDYNHWAMHSFIICILQPFSYALYVDLLAGNLPVCFFELRFLLESLAKHYLADARYPSHLFFEQKLEFLEIDLKKTKSSITEMMRELDKVLMIEFLPSSLWQEISEKWIHTRGLAKKITNYIVERQSLPPWGLIIPGPYTRDDLPEIYELKEKILKFKQICNEAVKSWKSFL